jgi:hypothetical protein
MTWPSQYQKRIISAVDELAFRLARSGSRDRQEEEIQRFGNRVRLKWREVFASFLSTADIDEMIADIVAHVRKRRDFLERHGAGSA